LGIERDTTQQIDMSRTVVGLTRQKVEGLCNGSERVEIVAENCWVGTDRFKCRERLKDWDDKGWRDCGMVPGGLRSSREVAK
jgi:hypothetical protein